MKKLSLVLMALLATLCFASGAYCAEGDEFSTTSFRIDGNGQVFQKALVENISSNDTVTAAESGKTFLITSASGSPAYIALPDAATGLIYHFIDGNGNRFAIDPDSDDTIKYASLSVGDRLISPASGAAGDSLTIIATDDSTWFVNDHGATFVDNN